MLRNIIFYFLIILQLFNTAFAQIDVVYPTEQNKTTTAESVFFIGNTDTNADFTINSEPVKLWNNNFFVHVIPLSVGKNTIKLISKKNNNQDTLIYTVTRKKPSTSYKAPKFIPKKENTVLYTLTTKERSTIRNNPTGSSSRLAELQENIVLYLTGSQGEYYKIDEQGDSDFWIHKTNIRPPIELSKKITPKLHKTKHYSDDFYEYSKFYLSRSVMYTLQQNGNEVKLTLYGIQTRNKDGSISPNFEYIFKYDTPILGFEGYYENNNFIYKRAKFNEPDPNNPLKGVRIFIDPGHGGNEKGSVGPTRICEKDINLKISTYLIELLKDSQAIVTTSRTNDTRVGLYDRVKTAKKNNAQFSLSIHANALPDGKNPYIKHGAEVHYYNENSKALAQIIQNDLSQNLNLKDGGIHKSSFALNRSTNPVSILIEVAYMINPEEYMRLQNPEFQKNVAKSIKSSLEKYILSLKNYEI